MHHIIFIDCILFADKHLASAIYGFKQVAHATATLRWVNALPSVANMDILFGKDIRCLSCVSFR